jgi:DNA (cytosine-5)-methyltransferase 1
MLTFGSLFAGIGGFDLGFERAGFQCKWQVEIDDYATRVLERHWPNVHRERDIRQCGRHNLDRVDCIIGGWPCQDISYAGAGAGLNGARSGLFFEAARLVRELQPRAVVLENVAGLLTRGLDRVLGTLASFGFDAEWHCIPAAALGAPHIRDRVFIIGTTRAMGNTNSTRRKTRAAKREVCGETRKQVLAARGENVSDTNGARRKGRGQNGDFSGQAGLRGRTGSDEIERVRLAFADWWATEPDVGRVAHGVPKRVDRLRCLGNAIVPQVAEVVARIALARLTASE